MWRYSPLTRATTALPTEAKSISHPVAEKGSTCNCHFRERTDPTDQLKDEHSRIEAPIKGIMPAAERCSNLGQNRTATPPIPKATPTKPRDESLSPRKTKVSSSK